MWVRVSRAGLMGASLLALSVPTASAETIYHDGSVLARVSAHRVVLANDLIVRSWLRHPFVTDYLDDRRPGAPDWVALDSDFSLSAGPLTVESDAFSADSVGVSHLAGGGLRLRMTLGGAAALPGVTVVRTVEAYPDIAGFRTKTTVRSLLQPLPFSGFALERLAIGSAAATLHAFRAGGDWRYPDWPGPQTSVGYPHAGDWRETTAGGPGQGLAGPGEWISMARGGSTLFAVSETNDFPSSRVAYTGGLAAIGADYTRDVLSLGPFEEQIHVENPLGTVGRARIVRPGHQLRLPAVFTGVGASADDEAWQFHKYLVGRRMAPYPHAVVFNSNGTDDNVISTGAKDDMNYATVQQVAPIARRLGVETFVLDDGWQARSGDWHPDSRRYPEPRWDGRPGSKFAPRFPDPRFEAVREAIAPMRLGLWMSPTFFNPSAVTFHEHPEWACAPLAAGLVADNLADPDGGSNEAGLGPWSPAALDHVQRRIAAAINNWDVRYFKFDFLVWLDCLDSAGFQDLYGFHDAFLAMLDQLQHRFPGVTFQIDETNDYRLFPFESITRGPTWFQNGSLPPDRMLHNLWQLSPHIPTFALGQSALADADFEHHSVDTLMAAALLSHITFFSDIRQLPDPVIDRIGEWTRFYEENRSALDGVVYPLLQDPIADDWTALQAWDPEAGEGALAVFRQQSADSTRSIALRNVPPGRTFDIYAAPDRTFVETVSSAELSAGLEIELPSRHDAKFLLIEPSV